MQQGSESRPRSQPSAINSLKKVECIRCLPPRTIGSSYSYWRSSISGSPFSRTSSAELDTGRSKESAPAEVSDTRAGMLMEVP